MPTTLVQANLNFDRSPERQRADVRRLKEQADIVCTCEDVRPGGKRERVIVHGWRVRVEKSGARLAALSRRGQRIGWRRFAWKDIDIPEVGTVRVVSAHMPPLRMQGVLYAVYAARLRSLLRSSPYPWLVAADWNWLIGNDPAGLERHFGARFYGRRIDGWAVHPALIPNIARCWIDDPKRRDKHVFTFLQLREIR